MAVSTQKATLNTTKKPSEVIENVPLESLIEDSLTNFYIDEKKYFTILDNPKKLFEQYEKEIESIKIEKDIGETLKTINEVKKLKETLPKKPEECLINDILDYVFYLYFFVLSLIALSKCKNMSIMDKYKFAQKFCEQIEDEINRIKVRIERIIATHKPELYQKLSKYDDYIVVIDFISISIQFLSVCYEFQKEYYMSNRQIETKKENKKEEKKEKPLDIRKMINEELNTLNNEKIENKNKEEGEVKFLSYDEW